MSSKDRFIGSKLFYKLVISFLIVSFIMSFITMFLIYFPRLKVDSNTLNISYNTAYKTPDIRAYNLLNDYSDNVLVDDNVVPGKTGTYDVNYYLKYGPITIKKDVKVNIIDDTKPVITLVGSENASVCPNQEYVEEGYTAYDDYDGDLTDKVIISNEDNIINYTVSDNSLNTFSINRNLLYVDNTKPSIKLNGSSIMYVKLGSNYKEPGYKASDNCLGDLTDKVKVSGSVNTKNTGKNVIIYSVSDGYNETEVTREVWVYKNSVVNNSTGEKGVIYLTFDDGPSDAITKQILNILKDEGVKATFFVTTRGSDSVIKREYNEGHTVALHTASHDYKQIYSSVNNYFNDLEKVKSRVKKLTGEDAVIIRFPGGSSNTVSRNYDKGAHIMSVLTSEVLNRGYRYFDWNVDSGDAGNCVSASNKSNCVYKNVTKNLSKNKANVVLMHDIKSYSKDALRDIIAYGKVNGYTFKAITKDTAMVVQRINN